MLQEFKLLLDTKAVWLPVLGRLTAGLAITRPGRRIETQVKEKLTWLQNKEFQKAFFEAFTTGVRRYSQKNAGSVAARSAARVLTACAESNELESDLSIVLDQIFSDGEDQEALLQLVSRRAVLLEDAQVSPAETATALRLMLRDYLRPAFRRHPYFVNRLGFQEITTLLRDISASLRGPTPDMKGLREEYRAKMVSLYEITPMQGISPKVQNRTIGIRMEDIFVPLKAIPDPVFSQLCEYLPASSSGLLGTWTQLFNLVGAGANLTTYYDPKFVHDLKVDLGKKGKLAMLADAWKDSSVQWKQLEEWAAASPVTLNFDALFDDRFDYLIRSKLTPATLETVLKLRRAVVRGDPGCGKSTLLRYVIWALASGEGAEIPEAMRNQVPVLIRAIEFGEALELGRVEVLEEYLAECSQRFWPLVKSAIASGNALLLIDGLDEVSKLALRNKVKQRVDEFLADPVFAQNSVLITTRIVGYERTGLTGQLEHFTISELDDSQIEAFLQRWYQAIHREMPGAIDPKSEAHQLFTAIRANESIHKMARNPLLLTIIALIKWQGRALPELRVQLYDAAAQTLIRSWPLTQRHVEFDEPFIREWLAPIALHIIADKTGDFIDEYSLMDELVSEMRRLKSRTAIEARTESRQLLDSLSEHSGFLLPRGTDHDGRNLYGFLHQTFAEFLAAYCLVAKWEDKELDLVKYAHDPYWQEVLLLMAGHLGINRRAKAGQFLQAVRCLNSSPYENFIHRDLLLACQILADGVPAGPADVVESILLDLLVLWQQTAVHALRDDIQKAFQKLRTTEYGPVLARLAVGRNLTARDTIVLARQLGAYHFRNQLLTIVKDRFEAMPMRLAAAELVAPFSPESRDVIYGMTLESEGATRLEGVRLLIGAGDTRGIALLLDILTTSELPIYPMRTLAGCKHPAAVEAVARLLETQNPKSQSNAAGLLVVWGEKRGLEALPRLATSEDLDVTGRVRRALSDAQLETFGADYLAGLLETPDPELRVLVAEELTKRNDSRGIEALVQLLSASSMGVRLLAGLRLDDRGDARAIPTFVRMLGEASAPVAIVPARRLAKRGIAAGTEFLHRAMSNEDPTARVTAASDLLRNGDPSAETALLKILSSEASSAAAAAVALIQWGKTPLHEICTKFPSWDEPAHSSPVMEALSTQNKEEGIEILISLLDHERLHVRAATAELLANREEPSVLRAFQCHLAGMLQETTLNGEAAYVVDPPAESAYKFITRHLSPSGMLPE